MKKIIAAGLACLAATIVSLSSMLQPAEKQDFATITAMLNNHGIPQNRKDIGSAD